MKSHEIMVTFTNNRTAVYTMAIYDLLITDRTVKEIMDNRTGEILFERQ